MSYRSMRAQKRAAKQRNLRILLIAVLVLAILGAAYLAFGSRLLGSQPQAMQGGDLITNPSGLQYRDTLVGTGSPVKSGDTVSVHYSGFLADGTKFDSSLDRGEPFEFTIGAGRVIKGWEEGLIGMQPGGKRTLVVPPEMGYGPNGYPPVIPANATLTFEIELLAIK